MLVKRSAQHKIIWAVNPMNLTRLPENFVISQLLGIIKNKIGVGGSNTISNIGHIPKMFVSFIILLAVL